MDQLTGPSKISYNVFSDLLSDWNMSQLDIYSWKKIWDLDHQADVQDGKKYYAGGTYGSTIAVHIPKYRKNCNKNSVSIYDMKYNLIHKYVVNSYCDRIFFYVTSSDHLIVLTNKGNLLTYFCGSQISNIRVCNKEIIAADFWENGLVYMTEDEIYYASSFSNPELLTKTPEKYIGLSDFQVIPPEYTDDNLPIIFMSDYSTELIVVQKDSFFKMEMGKTISGFAFSRDYLYAAFMCIDTLVITTISLDETLFYLEIKDMDDFIQICWLENVAPVIAFKNDIAIIGAIMNDDGQTTFGDLIFVDQLKNSFDGRTRLFPSEDSILVLSDEVLFKLSRVSDELHKVSGNYPVYSIARLIDAYDKRSSSKLLQLKAENLLDDAIYECLKAATEVESIEQQRLFLLSAMFGRSYSSTVDISEFSKVTQTLRICNAFYLDLNTIFTPSEREKISTHDILMRCCNRGKFSMAIEMADYLHADKIPIMTEWCCSMANVIENDENAFTIISKKKNEYFDSNAIAIALRSRGRLELAKKVADDEKSPARVVHFYVLCELWKAAFDAAVKSSDMSLFIDVLNEALRSNCQEKLISRALFHDSISASTFSKLAVDSKNPKIANLFQTMPTTTHTIEIVVRNYIKEYYQIWSLEKFLTMKATVKLMISKYNLPWVASVYYSLKHMNHVFRAEDHLSKEKGDRKYMYQTFNKVFDTLVENNDLTYAMNIVKETQSNEKRYMVKIGQIFAKKGLKTKFFQLGDLTYKDYWSQYILMCYFTWGKETTIDFINTIKNPKKSVEFKNMIDQNDFPNNLFNAKSSVKMFSSKIF
ncbi:hypothetical protein TRFO_24014 [Tritrichomonas foetus]|uniref:Vps16 N-terminal domain-containing protein n=1 Tax=Tritrichomonas foetus TaxID=1144522 RepID=A0A1J4K8K3_9EUKA|nr:hypothetical protein TRFO_24014 [Tritrichomonas foetus]|eukprot:OHT07735.1 hypothetical protein TRFO_24014 [Tritrichomonas foetus]